MTTGEEPMRTEFLKRATAFLAVAVLAACGGGGDGGSADSGAAEGGDAPAAATIDPTTVGTISGTVNFAGTPPAATAVDMSEEADCAAGYGADGPKSIDVVAADGKLANVFVHLTGVTGAPAPTGFVEIDQHNCRYSPHVLGVQVGQDL